MNMYLIFEEKHLDRQTGLSDFAVVLYNLPDFFDGKVEIRQMS